jgi:hypothetical protein
MSWENDQSTAPDPNTPRGRSVIAARIMRLEAEIVSVRYRLDQLESHARGAIFVLVIVLISALTLWLQTKGKPS